MVYSKAGNAGAFIFSLLLPPGFYIFALRAICGFENHLITTSIVGPDPDKQLRLFPLIIAAIVWILVSF
jgi:ATP-binding cassette subfamily A (ABC1) protein 3